MTSIKKFTFDIFNLAENC